MPKKSFIDYVKVMNPCTQDWEKMHGNKQVRFCDHCAKNVTDISTMTRKSAKRLVRKSKGHLCVRYIKDSVTNSPYYADDLVHIQRRPARLATGVMSASLLLSSAAYAQGQVAPVTSTVVQKAVQADDKQRANESESGKKVSGLRGTVTDPNSAVVPGVEVSITSEKDSVRNTKTDENGNYHFDGLEDSRYLIRFSSPGFRLSTNSVSLEDGNEQILNATLNIGEILGGVVVVSVQHNNPLMNAVSNDDVEAVRDLIINGESVNYRDKDNDNTTPLFLAVENGNVELTRMLLKFGAKVNARDSDKQTPLMRLDDDANAELVELLLLYGAKVDLKDKEGNTALIIAAEDAKPEVIKALLRANPDVNAANDEGQTALMNAADDDNFEKVKMLLDAGAEVNAKNNEGDTAWDLTGDDKIEELLVSFGAAVDEDETGETDDLTEDN